MERYDSYRVEFVRTLRFKKKTHERFSNPHRHPYPHPPKKTYPHSMSRVTTNLASFIQVVLSDQYKDRVSSMKPFSRIMINHSVNNEPAACAAGIAVSVRLNIQHIPWNMDMVLLWPYTENRSLSGCQFCGHPRSWSLLSAGPHSSGSLHWYRASVWNGIYQGRLQLNSTETKLQQNTTKQHDMKY